MDEDSLRDLLFEYDFCTFLNLLRGMDYDTATAQAAIDVNDVRRDGDEIAGTNEGC